MKTANLTLVSLLMVSIASWADYRADVFEQGSGKSKKLYTFEHKSTPAEDGEKTVAVFKDLEGNVVFEEKVTLRGTELVKSEISQNQTKQSAVVEVKEGKVFFSKTIDGKTKTSEEKLGNTFVMTGNFQKFIQKNWADLSAGKTIDFRYGVWDRQETVGFGLTKTGEEDVSGQKALVLRMKPSSFIIAALVKPIIFKYASDGSRLLEMNGRVAPKQKSGDSFKDLDAEVVYFY
jgi:hypothetical protein